MDIKEKGLGVLKTVLRVATGFLTQRNSATRKKLKGLDFADIFIALSSTAVFGCLVFGLRALLTLAICAAVFIGFDYIWDIAVKKQKKGIRDFNFSALLSGYLLGLILSSRLHILLVIAVSLLAAFLEKTLLKKRTIFITAPAIIARGALALVFFKAFCVYALPFVGTATKNVPLDVILKSVENTYSAKYLFFGLHSGAIGEISVLLIVVGGIYLILRRIINPIIPISFIATSTLLSLSFGENLAISLLGGGIFFAAFYMTLSYSFTTTPLYKKVVYGVACGVLTFLLRLIFNTEVVYLAVLLTEAAMRLITLYNIKRGIRFLKKPDFKKLLKKSKKIFWV